MTRDSAGGLHALRNVCIHAGYPVCDAEEGDVKRLVCPYHGWEFALDGKLLEPELSARIDPARLRMGSYPITIHSGLIFVDVSGKAEASELGRISTPDWLPAAQVTRRARYITTWNWKFLRNFLRVSPHLFFDGSADAEIDFGPLSFLFVQSERAVLLRIIPKFPGQTGCDVIELAVEGEGGPASDALGEALLGAGMAASSFRRSDADWYWTLMSAGG